MPIMRWHPLRPVSSIRDEFNRLFEDLDKIPEQMPLSMGEPAIDLWETNQDVMLKADLPGIDPDNIQLEVTENSISISGESKSEEEYKDRNFIRKERSYGKFSRTLALPASVKPEDAEATFKDGLLEIRLPKSKPVRGRVLEIKRDKSDR
jgi:HSP20 family protein